MLAGEIEVKMGMDNSKLKSDAAEANGIVANSTSSMAKSFGAVSQALGVIGVGLSFNYFRKIIDNSVESMDKLHDLSLKTRLTVEELSGLKLASEQSGTNIDAVAKAMNFLEQNIGRMPEKFAALGVTARDPLEAFKQLADILNKIEDPSVRAATATAALGRQWQTVAPLLAEGSVQIGKMVEVGRKLSTITTEDAEKADQLKDRLAEFHMAGDAFRNNMTRLVLGPLLDITTAMSKAAQEGGLLKAMIMGLGEAGKVMMFGATGTQIEQQKKSIAVMQKQLQDEKDAQKALIDFQEKHGKSEWQTKSVDAYKLSIKSLEIGIEQLTRALENMQKQAAKPLPDAETEERAKQFIPKKKARAQKQSFGGDQFGGGFIKTGFGDIAGPDFGGDTDEMLAGPDADTRTAFEIAMSYRRTQPMSSPTAPSAAGGGALQGVENPAEQVKKASDAKIEALVQSLKTEWEIEDENYLEKKTIVDERMKNDTENYQFWLENDARLTKDHAEKVKNIEKAGWSEREKFAHLSLEAQAADVFGTLVSITQGVAQHNRAMFETNKVAGIAMALINAYEGIALTMAKYPYPLNLAMAAAHAVAAFAQVQAIQGTTFGGGGSGSAPSAAGSTPAQPVSVVNAAPTSGSGQATAIHLHGENYSRKQVKDLVEQINERTRDGGRVSVE